MICNNYLWEVEQGKKVIKKALYKGDTDINDLYTKTVASKLL